MINAVSSSSTPVSASAPYFPPTSPDHKPLIDPTDPPREPSPDLIKEVMTPGEIMESTSATTSFPTPPPTPPMSGDNSSQDDGTVKKHFSPKTAVAAIAFVLMLVGAAAGFYLTQENQDLRQQASESAAETCPDTSNQTSQTPGSTQCSGDQRQVSVNIVCETQWQKDNCRDCDKYRWASEGSVEWCDADNTYHTCRGGNSTSTGKCCGPNCNAPTPPDNTGLDPNVPRTAAQICSAKGGSGTSDSTADPNCSAQGGASCNIGSTNFCCYGDGKNASGVVQRDGNCYNSARECKGPYTIQKYSCDGATGFCSTHVSTYQSDSKPGAEACTQFEIVGADGVGCSGVGPSGGTAGCGSTGGPTPPGNEPPVVTAPVTPPIVQKIPVGYHDENTCETVSGWTCDPDKFDASVDIHFYIGTQTKPETYVGKATADKPALNEDDRVAIAAKCNGNGNRRFSFPIPENVKTQTDKYLYAIAINIGANGATTHVEPGTDASTQNPILANSPKQIVSCVTAQTPTASFATVCKDNVSPTGLRYDLTISNITGTAPFNFSDVFLSFPSDKDNARIKAFLGASSYGNIPGWYGYRIYKTGTSHDTQTFTSWTSGNLSMVWDKSYTIGRGGKTIEQLAAQMSTWQNDTSIPAAERELLKNYKFSVAANLSMGGVFNNGVGSAGIEISSTACTTPVVVGPMCMFIKAVNPTTNAALTTAQLATLKKNEPIKFQCGANAVGTAAGVTYQFQVLDSNKKVLEILGATGQYSAPYTPKGAGSFYAQCRICTPTSGGGGEPVCQEWYYPSLPPTQS